MSNEVRKVTKATSKHPTVGKREVLSAKLAEASPTAQLKALLPRLGLPVMVLWVVFGPIAAFVDSTTTRYVLLAFPVAGTVLAVAVMVWASRQAKKAQGVASILKEVHESGDRAAALEKLEAGFKKGDPAKIFAQAQLELQDDPRKALKTLELINLNKVMAQVADEARSQRAMIHLMLGEVSPARQLVDNIDIKRQQDPKGRAMMASVMSEAWARSGASKKAIDTLDLFDPDEDVYEQIRPQLWRARAFAYAYGNDPKGMRRALKKLLDQDARLLGGFLIKKTHPLLQKEAKKLLEQSGQVPRKMVFQRRP